MRRGIGFEQVYFIATADRSMVKIGLTNRPRTRLSALIGWSPVPLELLAVAPGNRNHERAAHHYFLRHHSHREWFFGAPEIFEMAATIRETGKVPPILENLSKVVRGAVLPRPYNGRTPEQRAVMSANSRHSWDRKKREARA